MLGREIIFKHNEFATLTQLKSKEWDYQEWIQSNVIDAEEISINSFKSHRILHEIFCYSEMPFTHRQTPAYAFINWDTIFIFHWRKKSRNYLHEWMSSHNHKMNDSAKNKSKWIECLTINFIIARLCLMLPLMPCDKSALYRWANVRC